MQKSIGSFLAVVWTVVILAAPSFAATEAPYILVDANSAQILTSRQPYQFWHPASITKLMTAYLIFQAIQTGELKWDSVVKVSARALAEPPSKMGFPVGTTMTVDNAVKMMLVHSSNDIAIALSETLGGTEEAFVARMNAQAAKLGMVSTHYDNANGLPDNGQITTARDLAVLAVAMWKDFPDQRSLFSIPAIKFGKRVIRSSNPLLDRYVGTNGLKTGFICASGYNLAASATRDNKTLIAIVLGATSPKERSEIAARLLDRGFNGLNLFKQDLATTHEASPLPEPVDMRGEVCNSKRHPVDEAEGDADTTALGPPFKLGEPIVVSTLTSGEASKTKLASKPDKASIPIAKASATSSPAKADKTASASATTATKKIASKDTADKAPAAKDAAKATATTTKTAAKTATDTTKPAPDAAKAVGGTTKLPPMPAFNSSFGTEPGG